MKKRVRTDHEKEYIRRPASNYIKLDSERQYAASWQNNDYKLCRLFSSKDDRRRWLDTDEAKEIDINYKIRLEDGYVYKPKVFMVYEYNEYRRRVDIMDFYTMQYVKNDVLDKLENYRHRTKVISNNKGKAKAILDEITKLSDDAFDVEIDLINLRDDLTRKYNSAIEMIDRALNNSRFMGDK